MILPRHAIAERLAAAGMSPARIGSRSPFRKNTGDISPGICNKKSAQAICRTVNAPVGARAARPTGHPRNDCRRLQAACEGIELDSGEARELDDKMSHFGKLVF